MPLQPPDLPKEARDSAQLTLRKLAENSVLITTQLRGAKPDELSLDHGHEAYVVARIAVAQHQRLAGARLAAWRYLVRRGDVIVAGTGVVPSQGSYTFLGINEGPFVSATIQALNRAQVNHDVENGTYEARLLSIPSFLVMALWLKDMQDSADLIMPLSPTPQVYQPYQPYSEAEFFAPLEAAEPPKRPDRSSDAPSG